MPVRELKIGRSNEHEELVRELVQEWQNPNPAKSEPVIVIEPNQRDQGPAHVYVIWSRWANIDRVERSEIIMDAAAQRYPEQQLLTITIAMGLTQPEADRLGLKY